MDGEAGDRKRPAAGSARPPCRSPLPKGSGGFLPAPPRHTAGEHAPSSLRARYAICLATHEGNRFSRVFYSVGLCRQQPTSLPASPQSIARRRGTGAFPTGHTWGGGSTDPPLAGGPGLATGKAGPAEHEWLVPHHRTGAPRGAVLPRRGLPAPLGPGSSPAPPGRGDEQRPCPAASPPRVSTSRWWGPLVSRWGRAGSPAPGGRSRPPVCTPRDRARTVPLVPTSHPVLPAAPGASTPLTSPAHPSPGNTPLPFVVNTVINIIIWFNI